MFGLYLIMLFSTGHDIRELVFDFCSLKTLTNFSASGPPARESVKFYLEAKLAQLLMVYFDRGKFHVLQCV